VGLAVAAEPPEEAPTASRREDPHPALVTSNTSDTPTIQIRIPVPETLASSFIAEGNVSDSGYDCPLVTGTIGRQDGVWVPITMSQPLTWCLVLDQ
jgi:hypothetical protein